MWRRTDLASYRAGSPQWETVLSVDALNLAEGESWVYKGHTLYKPRDGSPPTRTLLELSRGGADAVVRAVTAAARPQPNPNPHPNPHPIPNPNPNQVLREFDIVHKRFVPPSEGGFVVPEAKTRVAWQSADVLIIGTQFPGDDAAASLTDSGYPRTIREWRRGTPLEEATLTPTPTPTLALALALTPTPTPTLTPTLTLTLTRRGRCRRGCTAGPRWRRAWRICTATLSGRLRRALQPWP